MSVSAMSDRVLLVVHAERVADIGTEHAEGGAVELVDAVQAEQDDERVERVAAAEVAEVLVRRTGLVDRERADLEQDRAVVVRLRPRTRSCLHLRDLFDFGPLDRFGDGRRHGRRELDAVVAAVGEQARHDDAPRAARPSATRRRALRRAPRRARPAGSAGSRAARHPWRGIATRAACSTASRTRRSRRGSRRAPTPCRR